MATKLIDLLKQAISARQSFTEMMNTSQQDVRVATTANERSEGLRNQPQGTSMVFPNSTGNFNTMGMNYPIDIQKYNKEGNLVRSYQSVDPGIQNLSMGDDPGTVIETASAYKKGGPVKYQDEGFYEDTNTTGILDKERSGSIEPPSGQTYWDDWNQYFDYANPSEMGTEFNKDFLLKQIKNPEFRNRYRENYKLVTGEYPTDQELDTRLNAQINYVDMGPDHALSWPYSSTLPDASIYGQGIKKEHYQRYGPIILPFNTDLSKDPKGNYLSANPAGTGAQWHKQTPYGNIDPKLQTPGNILQANFATELADLEGINSWDIQRMDASEVEALAKKHNFKMPQHYKYPWMIGQKQDEYGTPSWKGTSYDKETLMGHEIGHSINSPQSPLWRTKNLNPDNPDLYQTHKNRPRNLSLQRYDFSGTSTLDAEEYTYNPRTDEEVWGPENPYQNFIMRDLFGVEGDPRDSGWDHHSLQMSEISSAKQEVLVDLHRKGLYDVTTEGAFNPEHLDAMLEKDYTIKGSEPNLYFESMGYNDLSNTYNKLSKTQQNITGHQENINITQQNLEDFNDLSEEDKISYLMNEDISNQYSGTMNDFVTEFNQGKKEKHHLNFQTASEILQGKKQKGKKYEAAKNFMSQYQSTFTETLEDELFNINLELQGAEEREIELNKKYEKLRPEVEDKLDIYFNQLVQNESTEEPSQAYAKTGGPIKYQKGKFPDPELNITSGGGGGYKPHPLGNVIEIGQQELLDKNKFLEILSHEFWHHKQMELGLMSNKEIRENPAAKKHVVGPINEEVYEQYYTDRRKEDLNNEVDTWLDWAGLGDAPIDSNILRELAWNKADLRATNDPMAEAFNPSFENPVPVEMQTDFERNMYENPNALEGDAEGFGEHISSYLNKERIETPADKNWIKKMKKFLKNSGWNFGRLRRDAKKQSFSEYKKGGVLYQEKGQLEEVSLEKPKDKASNKDKRLYWLNLNSNKNFVRRILEPSLNVGREVPHPETGIPMSHFMINVEVDGRHLVIPTVVDMGEEKLHYFEDVNHNPGSHNFDIERSMVDSLIETNRITLY